jgi:membrane protease YdiL (CAAX protease family)
MKNISKIKNQIFISIGYTLVMGLGWIINPHPYGEIENVIYMIPILILLSLAALYLIKKSKISLSSKKPSKSLVLWLFVGIIIYLIFNNVMVFTDGGQSGPGHKIALLFIATMLVGIAEEGFYRGYILNTIEKKIGIKKALLYSSLLFGLMHSVNFLAGPTLTQTIVQVLITSAVGYVFGVIYLSTRRDLLLIMFLHGIYDFLVFNQTYLAEINNSSATTLLTIPLLMIVWIISIKYFKKVKLS